MERPIAIPQAKINQKLINLLSKMDLNWSDQLQIKKIYILMKHWEQVVKRKIME